MAPGLDIDFPFLLVVLNQIITIMIAVFLGFKFAKTFPSIKWFAWSKILVLAGLLSLLFRGILTVEFSILITNLTLSLAHGFYWFFTRVAQQRDITSKKRILQYIIAGFMLVICWYTFVNPDIHMRIAISCLVYFLFTLCAICELLLPSSRYQKVDLTAAILAFCLTTALLRWGYHVASVPMFHGGENGFFEIQELNLTVTYVINALSEVVILIGVIQFIQKRKRTIPFQEQVA